MPDFGAEPIDPRLASKLDAFTVPALPGGFAGRALAAALALPAEELRADAPPLPRQRRSIPRRWWRGGAVGLGALAAGMLSISAAAMGYFGEPVRRAIQASPVIGKVVERVIERVDPERARRKAKLAREAKTAVKPAPAPVASAVAVVEAQPAEPLAPRWRARAELRRALADPEARKAWIAAHPEAAERIAERRAVRAERRRAIGAELRRRRVEAGIVPPAEPGAGPVIEAPSPRPWRLERRERLRQWRERRRQMFEEQTMQDQEPGPPPSQP